MKETIIRKATLNDLKSIQELNYALFQFEKENFDPTLIVDWPSSEEGKNYFKELINNEYVIVAIENEKIVGYLAGTIPEKGSYELVQYGEINNMIVAEKARGFGIGKQLIDCFKEYCKEKNIHHLKVVASAKNQVAIDFYKKQGFEDFNITLTMDMGE